MQQEIQNFRESQNNSSSLIISQFFTNPLIFDQISSFLTISNILKLSQISKRLHEIIQEKCKKIILQNKMYLIPSKTSIHQMRFYFDRCLTIFKQKENQQVNYDKSQKKIKNQKNPIQTNNKKKDKSKIVQATKQQDQAQDQIQNVNHNYNNIHLHYNLIKTIQNPFKYKTITYFQVGVTFTVCLNTDNQAYIFKTCQLININNQIKNNQYPYEKRTNVLQIKCKAQYLTYIKHTGQVYRCFGDKNSQDTIIDKQELVEWSTNIPIEQIQASFNYTLFKPKINSQILKIITYQEYCKYILGYDIDLQKINQKVNKIHIKNEMQHNSDIQQINNENKTTLILFNNITFKYNFIEFENKLNFTQIVIGHRQGYFLTDNFCLYVCYFQDPNENPNNQNATNQTKIVKGKLYHYLQNKTIVKIASGYNFYLALERQIHNVQKWTVDQVCKWVRQIQFQPYAKIFQVEKVDGKKLLTIDKNYMYNNLGITKPNMQQKFLMLLQQAIDNKNKNDTLYGWGKNQNGQLGSRNSNYIKQPLKIKISCLKQNQYIDSIYCGWFQTFIRTQKGRIYRTVNTIKKKKTKENQKQSQKQKDKQIQKGIDYIQGKKSTVIHQFQSQQEQGYDRKYTQKDKNNHKKKRKYTQQYHIVKKQTGHKKFQQEQKWIEGEQGKAFFVQAYKGTIFYIQCPSHKKFQPTKQKKLRTVKTILNKIFWSFQPNIQQQYNIGYMDKDMGLIQATIKQLKTFDYNENRIRYIKKNGVIVWDRETKLDHFN